MKNSTLLWLTSAFVITGLALATPGFAGNVGKTYETGFAAITRISTDLHDGLDSKFKQQLRPTPVLLEREVMPIIIPNLISEGSNTIKAVFVSAGFVQMINNLSHAKAIDHLDKGVFQKYTAVLAHETGETPLKSLPEADNPNNWSFDVLNEQVSNFNQMVGALVAIDMAHHYLGHYEKYAGQIGHADKQATPITNIVKPDEWHAAVLYGARNALECGLGVEGLKSFYECIEKMPTRPAWTAHFLGANTKVSRIKHDLEKLEADFFMGKKFKGT